MLHTDSGFYQLHVDGRLLLHTRAKRTVEHYLSEAHAHTSSERYVISVAQPYGRTSTDDCLLYTSPSPRDRTRSRMPSSA